MSAICIQVINPNTSLAMTETIGAAARAVAAPGTEILAVCPSAGVPSIEGHFDEAIAAVGAEITAMLAEMSDMKPDQLIKDRRAKFLAMGSKGLAA